MTALGSVGVTPVVEMVMKTQLRWFVHVERRPVDPVVRRLDKSGR